MDVVDSFKLDFGLGSCFVLGVCRPGHSRSIPSLCGIFVGWLNRDCYSLGVGVLAAAATEECYIRLTLDDVEAYGSKIFSSTGMEEGWENGC